MTMRLVVAGLVLTLVAGSAALAEDCTFTQLCEKSVVLHRQCRALYKAGQEWKPLYNQVKEIQAKVALMVVEEIKALNEHHAQAYLALCKAAADMPVEGERCGTSLIQSGQDLMAFENGLRYLRYYVNQVALYGETPEQKELAKKYAEPYANYYKVAYARLKAFFGDDCGG